MAQYPRLQLLQLVISQQAFALVMLMDHAGEGRQHARIQRDGLDQFNYGAGKVVRRARIYYGHRQAR